MILLMKRNIGKLNDTCTDSRWIWTKFVHRRACLSKMGLPEERRNTSSVNHTKPKSSSAVAERPRDASTVSFNSTIPRVQFLLQVCSASHLPVRTIRFCSVVFGITSSFAVIHWYTWRIHMCIARDRAWLVSRCIAVTAGRPWLLVALGA